MKIGLGKSVSLILGAFLLVPSQSSNSTGQVGPSKNEAQISQTKNAAHAPEYDVNVLSVSPVKRSLSSDPLYFVEYDYEFRGRKQVYIRGVGSVSAKGTLEYFVFDPQIEFRESRDGRPLVTVQLDEIIVFGGPPPAGNFPDDTEFSPTVREGIWSEPGVSFHDNAAEVLAKYFPSGYAVEQKDSLDSYKTQYREMPGLADPNLIGEVAVLVSHPFKSEKGKFYFHVRFAVRETRVKSSTFHPPSREVVDAAEDLIGKLTKELQRAGSLQR
jgi:hypothetical protein